MPVCVCPCAPVPPAAAGLLDRSEYIYVSNQIGSDTDAAGHGCAHQAQQQQHQHHGCGVEVRAKDVDQLLHGRLLLAVALARGRVASLATATCTCSCTALVSCVHGCCCCVRRCVVWCRGPAAAARRERGRRTRGKHSSERLRCCCCPTATVVRALPNQTPGHPGIYWLHTAATFWDSLARVGAMKEGAAGRGSSTSRAKQETSPSLHLYGLFLGSIARTRTRALRPYAAFCLPFNPPNRRRDA